MEWCNIEREGEKVGGGGSERRGLPSDLEKEDSDLFWRP